VTAQRVLAGVRLFAHGRPKCLKLVRSLVSRKTGIEIGGPSVIFRRVVDLPIYGDIALLDNCDFSQNTTWASHSASFRFSKRKPCGRTYFLEASSLTGIPDNQYDFLLASHVLEHLANPIRGLKEWQRVVKPGGHFIIVLPHYAKTFDRLRTPTALQHMIEDYERGTGEDDRSHLEETFAAHCFDNPERTDEETHDLLLKNFEHRMMHHHVFNEWNSKELLEESGLKVHAAETYPPHHIILVAECR
jgi:SAM-dependent methyltransferase